MSRRRQGYGGQGAVMGTSNAERRLVASTATEYRGPACVPPRDYGAASEDEDDSNRLEIHLNADGAVVAAHNFVTDVGGLQSRAQGFRD